MGAAGGPNMVEDGLVFYYDTGNGKSYAGEPTENLAAGREITGNSPNVTRTTVTDTLPDGSTGTVYEFDCQIVGDSNRTIQAGSFNIPANSTVTISFYVKNIDCTGFGGNLWTPTLGRVLGGITYPTVYTDKWVRVKTTYLIPDEGFPTVTTSPQLFRDAGIGRLRMTQPQFEIKPHATQYIDGTRSATQGLLDLTGNSTIDLSNVSFTSDAQVDLDGTSDYIDLGSDVTISPNNQGWTAEYVFNTDSASTLQHFNSAEADDFNANWLALLSSKLAVWDHGQGTWRYGNTQFSSDTWYHIAFVQESGTSMQFYVNGVAEGGDHTSFSWSSNYSALKTRYIGRYEYNGGYGRYFNGELPVTKLYNRALTAEEVQNNFNGIRSRFGI